MKLQVPLTNAFFPAALAAASISLALLLLPGAGTSERSSGVAPALRQVAGEVATAVRIPVHGVKTKHPKHAHGSTTSLSRAHSAPAHHAAASAKRGPAKAHDRHGPSTASPRHSKRGRGANNHRPAGSKGGRR